MKAELIALSLVAKLMAASLLMSTVAMALGAFAVVSPRRAAEIWASQRLQNITPERKDSIIRWYRVLGVFLFLGGMLVAVEGVMFSEYRP